MTTWETDERARHERETAQREREKAASPRTTEYRPFLVRCPVCLTVMSGVTADLSVTPEPPMPPHQYQPGYKCMGSGVKAILLGRGEVIPVPPPEPEPDPPDPVAEAKRWGSR